MLARWLDWALGIPGSFTEWHVPAAGTSGCGPPEVVPCLGRGFVFSLRDCLAPWLVKEIFLPVPSHYGQLLVILDSEAGFLIESEKEGFLGVCQPGLWPGVLPLKGKT